VFQQPSISRIELRLIPFGDLLALFSAWPVAKLPALQIART
jgi:hypothetical protein